MTDQKEAQRAALQNQLDTGTWPAVMMVFGYNCPNAARHSDQEFAELKSKFEQAGLTNIVACMDVMRFEEQRKDVPQSFNFSTMQRTKPDHPERTKENVQAFFATRDILVGTRGGTIAHFGWLQQFAEVMPTMASEAAQVFDKIFGEALDHLKMPAQEVSLDEMVSKAFNPGEVSEIIKKQPVQ
jgi:hypothetical protein